MTSPAQVKEFMSIVDNSSPSKDDLETEDRLREALEERLGDAPVERMRQRLRQAKRKGEDGEKLS